MATVYDFDVKNLDGSDASLDDYKGKVLLIVNVASKCGFTPQYRGLEALYQKYKDQGFEILAFPCNQFGAQEPGDPEEIANFCTTKYDVTFPMFEKVDVNGSGAHPLYKWIKGQKAGFALTRTIKWNFTKFLVDREGKVAARFGPQETPASIDKHIAGLL